MAKVELKKPVVEEISEQIKDAQAVVLVDHRGLTVAEDTELRKELRKEGVYYKVYKNTMMNFAFQGTDFEQMKDLLNGPSAIAVSKEDPSAPARVLYAFAKKAKALEIKGGVIEGKVASKEEIITLSKVPDKETLYSQVVYGLLFPFTKLAMLVKAVAEKAQEEGGEVAAAPAEEAAAPAEEAPAAEAEPVTAEAPAEA